MKKITLLFIAILFAITGVLAQTPNEFKYQAVLRDASGIIVSEAVTVDISILQGSASGTSVFAEQHSVKTSAQGLIALNIGSINKVDMSNINWASDIYFIEISVNSTVMGTSQLLSVPYALHANTASNITETQNLSDVLAENNIANAQIKNLTDPTDSQDAATKAYVDLLESQILELQLATGLKVKDYDGNIYSTVMIGSQRWIAENLKTTHYADGSEIPYYSANQGAAFAALTDVDASKAYTYYNTTGNENGEIYGALYTFGAATNGTHYTGTNIQGACPNGWHLPTDEEWKTLEIQLGMTPEQVELTSYQGTNQASQLAGNSELWREGSLETDTEFGTTGFSALPAGKRIFDTGFFSNVENLGYFWTATQFEASKAWTRGITYARTDRSRFYTEKSYAFSVRCLQD